MTLIQAIIENNLETITKLLYAKTNEAGQNPIDEVDPIYGGGPLYWAAYYGYTHLIQRLVSHGAKLNQVDKQGASPLFVAAQNCHAHTVTVLCDLGADANCQTQAGIGPVHIAASKGSVTVLFALYRAQADMHCLTRDTGANAFYLAVEQGYMAASLLLADIGLDLNKAQVDGSKAVHAAAANGHSMIINLLKFKNVKFNDADKKGRTPIYLAAQNGHKETMTALLYVGADISTAIEYASLAKEPSCFETSKALKSHFMWFVDNLLRPTQKLAEDKQDPPNIQVSQATPMEHKRHFNFYQPATPPPQELLPSLVTNLDN